MTRSGLTLLELVVVLAILATLTLVAVVSTENVVEQGRFDVTQRTLQNIDEAAIGPTNQVEVDGTRSMSGFVADTGRLPLATGTDPALQLAELWSNPRGIRAYGPITAPPSPNEDVTFLAGWRGPYLRLPQFAATQRLLDGWGNPFGLHNLPPAADGSTPLAAVDEEIRYVRSVNPAGAFLDLPVSFDTTVTSGTITGALTDVDTGTSMTAMTAVPVTVYLFSPDAGATGYSVASTSATLAGGFSFTFTGVKIGPKVLRAVYSPSSGGTVKSDIIHLRVPAGGLTRNLPIDLR